jgi:microsomal dipeptidase-like Zn-dependent dipeptidase
VVSADRGPWIDLHGHADRCFLAGLAAGHPIVTSLGAASVTGAVRAARAAGVTASDQPVVISHGQLGHPGTAHPRLLTAAHVAAVASAGGLTGAWPTGLTSRSLADFGTEIIRLTEVAGPGHVAIGTDMDGNYRPVLTSYHQLADLAGLLRDRGLPAAHIRQVLGGTGADLLNRIGS